MTKLNNKLALIENYRLVDINKTKGIFAGYSVTKDSSKAHDCSNDTDVSKSFDSSICEDKSNTTDTR